MKTTGRHALRVFISGLKKPLRDVLFSGRPPDLPKAVALAQEVKATHGRYVSAMTFTNNSEGKFKQSEAVKKKAFV